MKTIYVENLFLWMIVCVGFVFGQDDRPKIVFWGGSGITSQSSSVHGSFHLGADYEQLFSNGNQVSGPLFELGYAAANNKADDGSALFSANYAHGLLIGKSKQNFLFFTGGYTRLFGTGNGINFGAGVELYRSAVSVNSSPPSNPPAKIL
jgi:hypothetical protein